MGWGFCSSKPEPPVRAAESTAGGAGKEESPAHQSEDQAPTKGGPDAPTPPPPAPMALRSHQGGRKLLEEGPPGRPASLVRTGRSGPWLPSQKPFLQPRSPLWTASSSPPLVVSTLRSKNRLRMAATTRAQAGVLRKCGPRSQSPTGSPQGLTTPPPSLPTQLLLQQIRKAQRV